MLAKPLALVRSVFSCGALRLDPPFGDSARLAIPLLPMWPKLGPCKCEPSQTAFGSSIPSAVAWP
jgi:hypothetical protein